MYPIAIGITYEPPVSKYGRRLNAIIKEAQREAAEHWHSDILPGHFQPGAAEKYGYAPRTLKHEKRKRGKPPLVYTGEGRDAILGPAYIQPHPTRVTINLAAPSYFWATPPSKQPDKADEVSRMTFQESSKRS
ncbi:MAG: hypothetical protein ACYSWU_01955 [Planctomycetota bacterium]